MITSFLEVTQHSLDPSPFLKGGSKFSLPPAEGGDWKIKKRGISMVQGQVFLKGGGEGWHFPYLIFSMFTIFTFRNYFTLCKIVVYIWRKIIFFCHHNLSKSGPEDIP